MGRKKNKQSSNLMNLATVLSEASKKPYLDHPTDVSTFHPPLSPMISGDGGGGGTETTSSTADCNLSLEDEGRGYFSFKFVI